MNDTTKQAMDLLSQIGLVTEGANVIYNDRANFNEKVSENGDDNLFANPQTANVIYKERENHD